MRKTNKSILINSIIRDIYLCNSPQIQENRKGQILNVLNAAVNGDNIKKYLVIPVSKGKESDIYIYILTNTKFLQISIEAEQKVNTLYFELSDITSILFKSPNPKRLVAEVQSFRGVTGIEYSSHNSKITEFFQSVESSLKN